jgi:hypothetical protein
MWKKAVESYFEVFFQHVYKVTGETPTKYLIRTAGIRTETGTRDLSKGNHYTVISERRAVGLQGRYDVSCSFSFLRLDTVTLSLKDTNAS